MNHDDCFNQLMTQVDDAVTDELEAHISDEFDDGLRVARDLALEILERTKQGFHNADVMME
ncbi:MAG: hypothetical protein WCI74_05605 [Actinomycetes bacterium]